MNIVKMSFGGAAVALIILIDLATGQGPPGLTNYVGMMQPPPQLPEFRRPIPVRPLPAQYLPTGTAVDVDYADTKKEFEKESPKESKEANKESSKGFAKFFEKGKDDEGKNFNKEQKSYASASEPKKTQYYGSPHGGMGANYGPPLMYGEGGGRYEKEKDRKDTPAPGMLASLSQSMSKAWNSWG